MRKDGIRVDKKKNKIKAVFPKKGGRLFAVLRFVISAGYSRRNEHQEMMHATFTINSFDHMFGFRRYNTDDTSRNNVILAIITLGEGWHNNHHHYAVSNRNGFYWWEIDITYYLILLLSFLGIVREVRALPEKNRESGKIMK
jgi:fatty-acid desaturase